MKIFDGHADIWSDTAEKRKKGCEDIVKNFHLERFEPKKEGNLWRNIFRLDLMIRFAEDKWEKEFIYMLNSVNHEINSNPEIFNIIKRKGDFQKGIESGKLNVLMGVEGLRAIGDNLDWIDTLYNLG